MRDVTHLLITKYMLKWKRICSTVMLTPALNIKLTSKWHKTTKQEKLALVP